MNAVRMAGRLMYVVHVMYVIWIYGFKVGLGRHSCLASH